MSTERDVDMYFTGAPHTTLANPPQRCHQAPTSRCLPYPPSDLLPGVATQSSFKPLQQVWAGKQHAISGSQGGGGVGCFKGIVAEEL